MLSLTLRRPHRGRVVLDDDTLAGALDELEMEVEHLLASGGGLVAVEHEPGLDASADWLLALLGARLRRWNDGPDVVVVQPQRDSLPPVEVRALTDGSRSAIVLVHQLTACDAVAQQLEPAMLASGVVVVGTGPAEDWARVRVDGVPADKRHHVDWASNAARADAEREQALAVEHALAAYDALEPPERELFRHVAMFDAWGVPASVRMLSRLTGDGEGGRPATLDTLEARGLVATVGAAGVTRDGSDGEDVPVVCTYGPGLALGLLCELARRDAVGLDALTPDALTDTMASILRAALWEAPEERARLGAFLGAVSASDSRWSEVRGAFGAAVRGATGDEVAVGDATAGEIALPATPRVWLDGLLRGGRAADGDYGIRLAGLAHRSGDEWERYTWGVLLQRVTGRRWLMDDGTPRPLGGPAVRTFLARSRMAGTAR